jgi:cold shock CspA family protein
VTGKVVKYDAARAFGKLWAVGHGAVFVHRDDLLDVLTLTPGQRVTFRLVDTGRGPRAVEVLPLENGGVE